MSSQSSSGPWRVSFRAASISDSVALPEPTSLRCALCAARAPEAADTFPQDVLELQAFLAPVVPGQRIQAVPAAGTQVRLWILGSSNFGAMLAAELGLPYAFASHFAPELLIPALQLYRHRFKPSEQLERPYAMVGVNIIAAESDDEAKRLATTQQMSFTNIFRGARGLSQPPIDDIETYWSPSEKAQATRMLACSIVGSPDTVRAGIEALVAETAADELIVVSDVHDHAARLRSFELIAQAALAGKAAVANGGSLPLRSGRNGPEVKIFRVAAT
jgi:luciferase family oxidoreductase group 1